MNKVLGIGNALVDIITFLNDDSILEEMSFPRGSMQLVDETTAIKTERITAGLKKHLTSGGSSANTVHGLARLGIPCGFIGTVGNDKHGDFFESDLKASGIEPIIFKSQNPTGCAISMVSKDGERTFATYLGAATYINDSSLNTDILKDYNFLHLEGYLVQSQETVIKALDKARALNIKVSLDLASYNIVENNRDFLVEIARDYVDILFANEDEAKALSKKDSAKEALAEMSLLCPVSVVKKGSAGSILSMNGNSFTIDAFKVNCIDTTGAGDLYASGFIYGYLNNFSPEKCGKIASLLAGKVIENAGAKIGADSWKFIYEKLEELGA